MGLMEDSLSFMNRICEIVRFEDKIIFFFSNQLFPDECAFLKS